MADTPEDIAKRITTKYPPNDPKFGRRAVWLMERLDLPAEEVFKIGKEFYKLMPFKNRYEYAVFAERLPIEQFFELIERNIPENQEDHDLIYYWVRGQMIQNYGIENFKRYAGRLESVLDI